MPHGGQKGKKIPPRPRPASKGTIAWMRKNRDKDDWNRRDGLGRDVLGTIDRVSREKYEKLMKGKLPKNHMVLHYCTLVKLIMTKKLMSEKY